MLCLSREEKPTLARVGVVVLRNTGKNHGPNLLKPARPKRRPGSAGAVLQRGDFRSPARAVRGFHARRIARQLGELHGKSGGEWPARRSRFVMRKTRRRGRTAFDQPDRSCRFSPESTMLGRPSFTLENRFRGLMPEGFQRCGSARVQSNEKT